MILCKKNDFIIYDDGTHVFSDNNLKIALDDIGDNIVLINIHRNTGHDYKNILTTRFPAIEITDIDGVPYGSTPRDVIFELNKGAAVNIQDQDGEYITVQNPFPTDGDSIYCKDINHVISTMGDFTGEVCDLFNDYQKENIAASVGDGGVNPKSFTVAFERPVVGSLFGLGSSNTSISNAKLTIFGIAGEPLKVIDFSADDTKRSSLIFRFEQQIFAGGFVEFYTDDEVALSGAGVTKSQSTSIEAINGLVSPDNSTSAQLLADGVFVGPSVSTLNYGIAIVSTKSDQASAVDGLSIQQSTDNINWDHTDEFSIAAGAAKTFTVQTAAIYLRIVYTNGAINQGYFRLQTTLKPVYVKPSSHRIADNLSGQDDAELVKSIISGENEVTGIFENIETFENALKVTDGLVHKKFVNNYFVRDTGITANVTAAVTSQDRTITVDDETGFLVGDFCQIRENGTTEFTLLKILVVAANLITVNRPIDNDYTTAADLFVISKNMAVDGSVTPVSFRVSPPVAGSNTKWQITRMMISMTHTSAGDDGKFGGGAALTNAVLLRTSRSGIINTATMWFANGDMKADMFNVEYSDKAPAGLNGTSGRWTFTESAAIVDLEGGSGDYAEILIQDAVNTGNTTFEIKTQGRIFGN